MNKTRKTNTKLKRNNRALQERNINLLNDMNEMFVMFQEFQYERAALEETIKDKDEIIEDLKKRLKVAEKWNDMKSEYIERLEEENHNLKEVNYGQ